TRSTGRSIRLPGFIRRSIDFIRSFRIGIIWKKQSYVAGDTRSRLSVEFVIYQEHRPGSLTIYEPVSMRPYRALRAISRKRLDRSYRPLSTSTDSRTSSLETFTTRYSPNLPETRHSSVPILFARGCCSRPNDCAL